MTDDCANDGHFESELAAACELVEFHQLIRNHTQYYADCECPTDYPIERAALDELDRINEEIYPYKKAIERGESIFAPDFLSEITLARKRFTGRYRPTTTWSQIDLVRRWSATTAFDFANVMAFEMYEYFDWMSDEWKKDYCDEEMLPLLNQRLAFIFGKCRGLTDFDSTEIRDELHREVNAAVRMREKGRSWYSNTASDKWSEPDSPSSWAKRFGVSWDTLKKRIDEKQIRAKRLSSKSYRIHLDDLPGVTRGKTPPKKSD